MRVAYPLFRCLQRSSSPTQRASTSCHLKGVSRSFPLCERVPLVVLVLPCLLFLVSSCGFNHEEANRTPGSDCQAMCNRMLCEDCLSSEDYGRCYGICDMTSATLHEQFTFCMKLNDGCDTSCYQTFTQQACQESCDTLFFADCMTSYQHEDCFSTCERVTTSAREQFIHCVAHSECVQGESGSWGECIYPFNSDL